MRRKYTPWYAGPFALLGIGGGLLAALVILGIVLAMRGWAPGGKIVQPIVPERIEKGNSDENTALLAESRWKKGDSVRTALVGSWVTGDISPTSYEFHGDGTFRYTSPLKSYTSTYRLLEDGRYLECTVPPAGQPGTNPSPHPVLYRLLVTDDELRLGNVYPDGRFGFGTGFHRSR